MKVVNCGFCGKKMPKPPKHAQEKYEKEYGEKNVCKDCREKMDESVEIPVEEED